MGSENLFHRRKAKKSKELARKKAKRKSYAKILIVCEGEKTEPNYFNELKNHLGLSSTNIIVTGHCGSNPMSVINHAFEEYRLKKNSCDPFDKVFCVFDRDAHPDYEQAVLKIESEKPTEIFYSITSVPCFEYWLLLHFVYTTQTFQKVGSKSGCDQVLIELKKYISHYQKGDESVFNKILKNLPQAKAYASKSLLESQSNGNDNPSTKIHELVEYLENI